jgi:hypothetical protein
MPCEAAADFVTRRENSSGANHGNNAALPAQALEQGHSQLGQIAPSSFAQRHGDSITPVGRSEHQGKECRHVGRCEGLQDHLRDVPKVKSAADSQGKHGGSASTVQSA